MKTIAFFNNKGGVGKTTLVYHLAWMFAERGQRVVVADLDPQANATAMFLGEDYMTEMWGEERKNTVFDAVEPLIDRTGDLAHAHVEPVTTSLGVILGSLLLSQFEDLLSREWNACLSGEPGAFRVVGDLAGADRIMNEALFIGTYPGLSRPMLDYMVATIRDFVAAKT